MKPKFIFSFLKTITSIGFYALTVIAVLFLTFSVLNLANPDKTGFGGYGMDLNFKMLAFGDGTGKADYTYTPDQTVRYQPIQNEYHFQVKPNSPIGWYSMGINMINLCLAIAVLWLFMRIFKDLQFDRPFRQRLIRRLYIMAVIFVVSDVVKMLHYILFNGLIHKAVTAPKFELLMEVGNGILTGLVVWVIAVIYQRGVELQSENDLTV